MCTSDDEAISYSNLCSRHRNYRWFLLSYFVTHIGESLTYVASMSLLEHSSASGELDEESSQQHHDGKYLKLAILVVVRLLPNTVARFPGGVLADTMDRKRLMWLIDVGGALVALCYCLAGLLESIPLLYACTVVQETLSGLYEPSRSAILPQLVEPRYLAKANTLIGIMWSLCFAIGSSLGGFLTNVWGPTTCFVLDSALYVASAVILSCAVHGNYSVNDDSVQSDVEKSAPSIDPDCVDGEIDSDISVPQSAEQGTPGTCRMLHEMMQYVTTSPAGPYVLIKGSAAISFGAADVMAVYYSTVSFNADDEFGSDLDSERLGYMFAAVGIGCLLGPVILPDQRSHLQTAIAAIGVLGLGFSLLGLSRQFWHKCLFTVVRAAGTANLWVDSSILLQMTTPPRLMGRISGIDEALALVGECVGAVAAGLLQDNDWTADQVAYMLSSYCLVLCTAWACWSRFRHNESEVLRLTGRKELTLELEPLR